MSISDNQCVKCANTIESSAREFIAAHLFLNNAQRNISGSKRVIVVVNEGNWSCFANSVRI